MTEVVCIDRPGSGDVVIGKDATRPGYYTVGTLEHRAELTCADCDAAMAQATKYALAQGVCVWQVDDSERFTLVFSPSTTIPS